VTVVKVFEQDTLIDQMKVGRKTDLEVYLRRPKELEHLKFCDFYSKYMVSYETPLGDQTVYTIIIPNVRKNVYIYERRRMADFVLCRIEHVAMSSGDVWYMRQLFLYCATTVPLTPLAGISDYLRLARTVDGVTHPNFQQAAIAAGIIDEAYVIVDIFEDLVWHETAYRLRMAFVNLTVCGYPTTIIYNNENFRNALMDDYIHEHGMSGDWPLQKLLTTLESLMQRDHGRSLQNYGLPLPKNISTEVQEAVVGYNMQEQEQVMYSFEITFFSFC
jgi:hypothetical protein